MVIYYNTHVKNHPLEQASFNFSYDNNGNKKVILVISLTYPTIFFLKTQVQQLEYLWLF